MHRLAHIWMVTALAGCGAGDGDASPTEPAPGSSQRRTTAEAALLTQWHARLGSGSAVDFAAARAGLSAYDAHELVLRFIDDARRLVDEGETDAALESTLTGLELAHTYLTDETAELLPTVLGWGLESPALSILQTLAQDPLLSASTCRAGLDRMTKMRATRVPFRTVFVNERATMQRTLEEAVPAGPEQDTLEAATAERMQHWFDHYAETFIRAVEDRRPEDFAKVMDELGAQFAAMPHTNPSELPPHLLSLPDMSALTLVHETWKHAPEWIARDMRARVEFDMTRAMLAQRIFAEAEGRAPSSLAELVPNYLSEVPRDLFADGASVRIATEGKRRWFYSVGPDRVDQKGLEAYDRETGSGDLLCGALAGE